MDPAIYDLRNIKRKQQQTKSISKDIVFAA